MHVEYVSYASWIWEFMQVGYVGLCIISNWFYASLVCDSMHAKYVIICMINKFYAYLTSGFMHV